MSKKRNDKESIICLTLKPSQSFFGFRLQSKENNFFFLQKKSFFKEKGEWKIEQKRKEGFLTALTTVIKKDPTKSIRKHANELKVHKKKLWRQQRQDWTPDLDYALWGV